MNYNSLVLHMHDRDAIYEFRKNGSAKRQSTSKPQKTHERIHRARRSQRPKRTNQRRLTREDSERRSTSVQKPIQRRS